MNAADTVLRLNASWVDYSLVALYFVFVLGIGWAAKSKVSSSIRLPSSQAGDYLHGLQVLPLFRQTWVLLKLLVTQQMVSNMVSKQCTTSGSVLYPQWFSWAL